MLKYVCIYAFKNSKIFLKHIEVYIFILPDNQQNPGFLKYFFAKLTYVIDNSTQPY